MRVGILTFFCVPNYGAMLQAYALWHYLEGCGHQIEFIDYALPNSRRGALWRCFITRRVSHYREILNNKLQSYVSYSMTEFSDSAPRTRRLVSHEELCSIGGDYDALIVGSDQLWNPAWCAKSELGTVMLDFAAPGVKRISYAVSFGTKKWPEGWNEEVAGILLNKMNSISVRESSGVQLVTSLSARNDAICLCDPTLLMPPSFYEELFSGEVRKGRYIFTYYIQHDSWSDDIAEPIEKQISRMLGIYEKNSENTRVTGGLSLMASLLGVSGKISVGQWIYRLAHASFVVTNSFHGLIFSLLFHKPFVAIPITGRSSGMNERFESLLSALHLHDRLIPPDDLGRLPEVVLSRIDWDKVDMWIASERAKAEKFLHEALQ